MIDVHWINQFDKSVLWRSAYFSLSAKMGTCQSTCINNVDTSFHGDGKSVRKHQEKGFAVGMKVEFGLFKQVKKNRQGENCICWEFYLILEFVVWLSLGYEHAEKPEQLKRLAWNLWNIKFSCIAKNVLSELFEIYVSLKLKLLSIALSICVWFFRPL